MINCTLIEATRPSLEGRELPDRHTLIVINTALSVTGYAYCPFSVGLYPAFFAAASLMYSLSLVLPYPLSKVEVQPVFGVNP